MGQADVLVIGGGIVGLAIATELRHQGATVTVLSRDFNAAAGHAAAGMLAPRAEGLTGPLFTLAQRSLALYPDWSRKLEELTGEGSGYWPCGILKPLLSAPSAPSSPQGDIPCPDQPPAQRLSLAAMRTYQPHLSADVTGGYWYPEEGQVDNRALLKALRMAAQTMGVEIQDGVRADAFLQNNYHISGVLTSHGQQQAGHYVLAAGAWSSELLPVPVKPRKGQLAALITPPNSPYGLHRVLYGEHIYIVPRQDGRIVLGATDEDVGFAPHNTAAGVAHLLHRATQLYPPLANFPLQECWWGYRPATPDDAPILGPGQCDNLTLATGHHRNGILLTPITAKLIADSIQGKQDALLNGFHWERFMNSPQDQVGRALPPTTPTTQLPIHHASTPSIVFPNPMQTLSAPATATTDDDCLIIAGRSFSSRLMTGTGKFDNFDTMRASLAASGSQIVTVAVRRVQANAPGHEGLAQAIDWTKIWMLPNTAGCTTADEAIRVARLGREMAKLLGQEDNNFVKLEVIPDAKYLLPDPIGTLKAAEQLVKEGFAVLPYVNADPILAKHLEDAGCATVMPLGSPIGSGQGVRNAANIQIIVENAKIPVVVDAGIGSPSEAAESMELGADALLINTAIAQAQDPVKMGRAMGLATEAGRLAYMAGRIPVKAYASASSPLTGRITG